ncbi:hypothetical protein D1641_00815, partial [Colidextribacter sp. OB.20]|nr:hypothetical protein [Colidextribacter sp. OB.20]
LAWAKAVLPAEGGLCAAPPDPPISPPLPVRLSPGPAPWTVEGDAVTIRCGEELPPVGWSQVLCNPEFGWLTDETGAGFLWSGGNSRENRLTSWANDPLAVGGQETITISIKEGEYSVFAAGDGCPCAVTYRPGLARWTKELEETSKTGGQCPPLLVTESFVPLEENRRILRFTLTGASGRLTCRLGEGEPLSTALSDGQTAALVTVEKGGRPCSRFLRESFREEQEKTLAWWRERVSALTVKTPDGALDRYLNGWCLYQVIACRLMARTSQYQNGGAFGFRDQLQDAASLLYTWPRRAREQLLLAASRQFEEGDVQHWWHPPQGAGVRTRISDDLLWLPLVLSQYCTATGDWAVLREEVPYLTARPLERGEKDRYEIPQVSERRETMYRHGLAAIQCALGRGTGPHGLAKMGGGDWNDGMDKVGGESVWLTWFLAAALQDFSVLCRRMDEEARADDLLRHADRLLEAAQSAWDGGWYRRGYYEDGTPLGSAQSDQCQIDSIAQSFAAFPGGTDRRRADEAVSAALDRLFNRENGVVRLFTPAFDSQGEKDPGYIKGYPAGVRENGGQYTHASVWLAMACFRLDRPADGWAVLRALLPERHPTELYRAEPYVIAADVSYAPGRVGRAGWSWYTGAAGWYWQTAVRELLGLKLTEGRLSVEPNLPPDWPGYEARWSLPGGNLTITVRRAGAYSARLDGRETEGGVPLLELEGEHRLEVTV